MKKFGQFILIILLMLVLAFTSLYVRDTTPDRKAVKNIEHFGMGSGELELRHNFESKRGYLVHVFGDDVYDYAVKAENGDLLAIRINDMTRQKLDKALVESDGERIPEDEANKILEDLLNRFFPGADRENVELERTGKHLEEFVYSTMCPMSNGESEPVYIALAFNGDLSGISTVSAEDIIPEVLKGNHEYSEDGTKDASEDAPADLVTVPVEGEAQEKIPEENENPEEPETSEETENTVNASDAA